MPGFLRQATATQARALGPFLSSTDFITPQTALTIANTDVKLVSNGAASVNKNSGGAAHRVNGVYGLSYDATDTANVGELEVSCLMAGALIVFDKFIVLEEVVYDALVAAAAPGFLQPTVGGRTLDVSTGGEAGLDWGNIGSPTTTQLLSGTTIGVATALTGNVTVATNNDKTGYTLSVAGIGDINTLLNTAQVENYAANGVNASVVQMLYMIQQFLTQRNIAGTTWTMAGLNGVTPAATFTLNSGTSPSAITRAT